jgi:hypothetical protein
MKKEKNNTFDTISKWLIGIALIFAVSAFVLPYLLTKYSVIDFTDTGQIGDTIGGIMNPFIGIASIIVMFLAFFMQYKANQIQINSFKDQKEQFNTELTEQKKQFEKNQLENHFFKMIDYYVNMVNAIKIKHIDNTKKEKIEGKRAFVIIRLQLIELLKVVEEINLKLNLNLEKKDIIDLAYLASYYGIDKQWADLLKSKLDKNYADSFVEELLKHKDKILQTKKINIGRTNQTTLSAYFRNMYNAIKLVNDNRILDDAEKKRLIKIFRAQLSNPELYVLFLNIMSRFGKKWNEEDNNFILKYEFIKNLPLKYCDKYSPKEFFNMSYEEDELMN